MNVLLQDVDKVNARFASGLAITEKDAGRLAHAALGAKVNSANTKTIIIVITFVLFLKLSF